MKETVYIETSVVSYYTSTLSHDLIIAGRQAITREKWHQILNSFDSYIYERSNRRRSTKSTQAVCRAI